MLLSFLAFLGLIRLIFSSSLSCQCNKCHSGHKSCIIANSSDFFIFNPQKVQFFSLLTHFCTILTWKLVICIVCAIKINFRIRSEFLPTLPIKYDHCAMPVNLLLLRKRLTGIAVNHRSYHRQMEKRSARPSIIEKRRSKLRYKRNLVVLFWFSIR